MKLLRQKEFLRREEMSELIADGIRKIYKKREVVKGITVRVKQGEIVGLLGPNGAGKTTSFYMIMGAVKPDGGKIFFDNRDISRYPMYKRARLGISYLPQESSVFRRLSVWDNIEAVLEMRGMERKERKQRTEYLLNLLNILRLKNEMAYTLSGGERRRLEVARALAIEPRVLLLDEPFTGIDPKTREEIQDIIVQLKSMNIGVLITDHNVRETLAICDRAYIIYDGRILLHGSSEELINSEEARKIYLGRRFSL